jgi:hypothetical protein
MNRYKSIIRQAGRSGAMWASLVWGLAIAATIPNTFAQGDITAGCG